MHRIAFGDAVMTTVAAALRAKAAAEPSYRLITLFSIKQGWNCHANAWAAEVSLLIENMYIGY